MSDVFPLPGISGLSFDSTLLSHLLFLRGVAQLLNALKDGFGAAVEACGMLEPRQFVHFVVYVIDERSR